MIDLVNPDESSIVWAHLLEFIKHERYCQLDWQS